MTPTLASHPPLTAADRCDRCGAHAYIRVTMPSGSELTFCAHHGHAYESRLREVSIGFEDHSDRLVDTPATAPADEH